MKRGLSIFRNFPELLVLVQVETDSDGIVRIDRGAALLNVFNHALFIDHKGRSSSPLELQAVLGRLLQDPVALHHGRVHIAQQREGDADLLGKRVVGSRTIPADSDDDRIVGFEFGQISLICLEFLRSTFGKGQDVKRQDHGLAPVLV